MKNPLSNIKETFDAYRAVHKLLHDNSEQRQEIKQLSKLHEASNKIRAKWYPVEEWCLLNKPEYIDYEISKVILELLKEAYGDKKDPDQGHSYPFNPGPSGNYDT